MMASLFLQIIFLFGLIDYKTVLGENCEWKLEFTGFSTQFKYYSTCDKDKYVTITMSTLGEYTSLGIPTLNTLVFATDFLNWDWLFGLIGESSIFQGYDCIKNKYSAAIGDIFNNYENCYFNLTTYLFEEISSINIYNFTDYILDKYTLKYDIDISEWPWIPLQTSNHLELCMIIQSEIGGLQNKTEDEFYLNFTYDAGFYISIPKVMECEGNINSNIEIKVNDLIQNFVYICIELPYCDGNIYYDPIIYSNKVSNTGKSSDDLTTGAVVGIVFGVIVGIVTLVILFYFCIWKKKKLSSYSSL